MNHNYWVNRWAENIAHIILVSGLFLTPVAFYLSVFEVSTFKPENILLGIMLMVVCGFVTVAYSIVALHRQVVDGFNITARTMIQLRMVYGHQDEKS
jgi:hypothetical protein